MDERPLNATPSTPSASRAGRPRVARWLLTTLGLLALLYAAAVLAVWARQESLLFHPVPTPPAQALATAPDVSELRVTVTGAEISVLRLRRPQPRAVVFYLHGNAGNLQRWFVDLDFYRAANVDLVMMDYRGFGKSTGRIESQAQLLEDARAVWRVMDASYRQLPLVLLGRSLGTGLAAALAADGKAGAEGLRAPALTVLISPYASMRSLSAEKYPWVPVGPLLRYPLPTEEWLGASGGPVLIVHGEADTLIPPTHAQRLAQTLGARARLVMVPGGTHSNVHESPLARDAIQAALAAL
jgi:alpha-beta hydrolase superfamily lysophospholipase